MHTTKRFSAKQLWGGFMSETLQKQTRHGAIQIEGGLLWLSPIIQVNDAEVSQLHTPAGWVSSSAVLYPWSWQLWGQCPSLPGEQGGGQKTGSAGKKGVLVTAVEVEQKGRRFKNEEHWVGKLLPLAPSLQEPLPCIPPASLHSSSQMSFSWLEDGQSKCWRWQLVFCRRFALHQSWELHFMSAYNGVILFQADNPA